MALFQYRGRGSRGDVVEGRLEAESADAVASQLFNTGITPIEITVVATKARDWLASLRLRQRPAMDDLILFTRQMHAMIKAGVPLIRGLNSLAESSRHPALAAATEDIIDTLESGRDLASSLAGHPQIFSTLYVSIVRVGENSGRLEEAFHMMYVHLQREKHTRQQVKSALRYPAMVLVAITIAIIILTGFVIPTFAGIFDQLEGRLPLPTRILVGISDFVRGWWLALLVLAALGAGGFVLWKNSERGRYLFDRTLFRLPLVGGIILRGSLARFARTFAMTYRSGVPLIQGLTLVSRAVDNEYLGERILQIRNGVERGEALSRTAIAAGLFTPLVIQMLQVGEETGVVDEMLDEVGEFYEREVDYDLANMTAIIEPLLIVALGVMVLILALGVFLPMWEIYRLALRG